MGNSIQTPHDALFKLIFRHAEHAAAVLRHLLPSSVHPSIDWESLRLVDGGRIDGELREHRADLVFRVTLRDGAGWALVLFEHKSGPAHFTALQMLRYATRELETMHAESGGEDWLPYVLAVLVYHDSVAWRSGLSLLDISGPGPRSTSPIPPRFLMNFPFLLDDLGEVGVSTLRSRRMAAIARLALFLLKRARHSGDLIRELRGWREELRAVAAVPQRTVMHSGLMRYILEVTDLSYDAMQRFLAVEVGPEAEILLKTTYDEILARGKAEGKAEGMATLLLQQMAKRHGDVPNRIVQKVQAASVDQLETWAGRVLTSQGLEEIFEDES